MGTPGNFNGIVDGIGGWILNLRGHHRNGHGFNIRQIHISIIRSLKRHLVRLVSNLLTQWLPRKNI